MSAPRAKGATTAQPCPCGQSDAQGPLPYADCCGRWHAGLDATPPHHAPTPEALMRSRYSAYVLGKLPYLLATWHPSTVPGDLELPPTRWLRLEIKEHLHQGNAGVVEFVARFRDLGQGGRAGRLHEISRFVCQGQGADARWLYVDGAAPPPAPAD
jgi:SEC-C motif domain protein